MSAPVGEIPLAPVAGYAPPVVTYAAPNVSSQPADSNEATFRVIFPTGLGLEDGAQVQCCAPDGQDLSITVPEGYKENACAHVRFGKEPNGSWEQLNENVLTVFNEIPQERCVHRMVEVERIVQVPKVVEEIVHVPALVVETEVEVQVPVVQPTEVSVEVPYVTYQDLKVLDKGTSNEHSTRVTQKTVTNTIEVPQIVYVDKVVDVPVVKNKYVEVPQVVRKEIHVPPLPTVPVAEIKKIIKQVPKEVQVHIPQIVHKHVEVPVVVFREPSQQLEPLVRDSSTCTVFADDEPKFSYSLPAYSQPTTELSSKPPPSYSLPSAPSYVVPGRELLLLRSNSTLVQDEMYLEDNENDAFEALSKKRSAKKKKNMGMKTFFSDISDWVASKTSRPSNEDCEESDMFSDYEEFEKKYSERLSEFPAGGKTRLLVTTVGKSINAELKEHMNNFLGLADADDTTVLKSDIATTANIRAQLHEIARRCSDEDFFVWFYAGHAEEDLFDFFREMFDEIDRSFPPMARILVLSDCSHYVDCVQYRSWNHQVVSISLMGDETDVGVMTSVMVKCMKELANARKAEEEYSIESMFWKMESKANGKGVELDMNYNMDPDFETWPLPEPPSGQNMEGAKSTAETVKEAAKDGAKKLKKGMKSVCTDISQGLESGMDIFKGKQKARKR